MTLKQLEYFLAIAENGSITKAAGTLKISQPPLSLQLKSLEEELGCQLFVRDNRNMLITHKGVQLRERAREIIQKVNETILQMQSPGEDGLATIRIGTISSICNRVLPDKILRLKEMFPRLSFALNEGSTTGILDMLSEGAVDFAIVREPFSIHSYCTCLIKDSALGENGEDSFVVLAKEEFYSSPEGDVVPLLDLKDKPLITHRRYIDLFTSACRQRGFAPKIICQNDNISSSLSWAGSGIGMAIAPYTSAIQNQNNTLIMKRIVSPTIVSRAFLVWNKSAVLTEEQKVLVRLFS